MATSLHNHSPRVEAWIPLPDHPYYLWQTLAQCVNLPRSSIRPVFLVYGQESAPSRLLSRLMEDTGHIADWHFWEDPRPQDAKIYNASMKPRLIAAYLRDHIEPGLIDRPDVVLYLDPDVIVLSPPRIGWPGPGSASDTDLYTGPDYLAHKGVLADLLGLIDLPPTALDEPGTPRWSISGVGAQYVIDAHLPSSLWSLIADVSDEAYDLMESHADDYHPEGDEFPVQSWCAEMYMTQLVMTKFGHRLVPDERMAFCWASSDRQDTETATFLHDAGVPGPSDDHFSKTLYQVAPWDHAGLSCPEPSPDSASTCYVALLRETVEAYPELTRDWSSYV